jgi:hypothetical protein
VFDSWPLVSDEDVLGQVSSHPYILTLFRMKYNRKICQITLMAFANLSYHNLFLVHNTVDNRFDRSCQVCGKSVNILVSKAVNREDKRSRRHRDRDFAKFERSRRYRER